jgi:hypothetical protein
MPAHSDHLSFPRGAIHFTRCLNKVISPVINDRLDWAMTLSAFRQSATVVSNKRRSSQNER